MKASSLIAALGLSAGFCSSAAAQSSFSVTRPVDFSQVTIEDHFWKPRIDKVATVTIPVCIMQTEVKTARIRNFEKVARKKGEKHEGIYYDDSDVFKALEAIAYALQSHPDNSLEKKADEWIDKIAAAQQPDGYLNTYYTLNGLDKRWTDMEKHEDYNAGHLIEAAVAYYNSTGKRKLLDVAIRLANHIDSTFRLANRHWVSGHEEIELALVKLYRTTGNRRYLDLSKWYLEQRGHGYGKGVIWDQWKQPKYCQDDVPVSQQTQIEGHAVRAMYLYTGAADVASSDMDTGYMHAMKATWEDVVYRNMYITGGIGSSGRNEGFTADYDLPNKDAYCETCASVGMVLWNQRMNLLTGESRYMDVLERSLYNGALSGLSLTGDRFFYGNPLSSDGRYQRSEWFGTACCPANIARLVASVGSYIYAVSDDAIKVNLFIGSHVSVNTPKGTFNIRQETDYPWNGQVKITVSPAKKTKHILMIRIPGWIMGQPVPGNTYTSLPSGAANYKIMVNGQPAACTMQNGYASIERVWKENDVVQVNFPMQVQRLQAIDSIAADQGRMALQRGPLVYCMEQKDHDADIMSMLLPEDAAFITAYQDSLLGGIVQITATGRILKPSGSGMGVDFQPVRITAIPYYAWANRGAGPMQVWIPYKLKSIRLNPE